MVHAGKMSLMRPDRKNVENYRKFTLQMDIHTYLYMHGCTAEK